VKFFATALRDWEPEVCGGCVVGSMSPRRIIP
jgi:hypothetical protein